MRNMMLTLAVVALTATTAFAADLTHETLAGIHVGESADQVRKTLGKPQHESKPVLGQATGEMESTMTWPHLTVGLGDGKVTYIHVVGAASFSTTKGVHVGDDVAKATRAYGALLVTDDAHNTALNFTAKDGHITEIYLGEGAE